MKPNNVLITADGQVKLADFGLGRFDKAEGGGCLTGQVAQRWYQPPELLYGSKAYGPALDMWAAGCIFGQMLLGRPLFAAETEIEQLVLIFRCLGTPTDENWPGVRLLSAFIEISPMPPLDLAAVIPGAPADALDLLSRLLCLDPARRFSALQARCRRLQPPTPRQVHSPSIPPPPPPATPC